MSGVLIGGLGGGQAFRERGNYVRFVPPAIIPGAGELDFSVSGLPQEGFVAAMHKREDGSGNDGDIGAADQLEEAESVSDFFVAPLVSADYGDAQHLHLGRLDQG